MSCTLGHYLHFKWCVVLLLSKLLYWPELHRVQVYRLFILQFWAIKRPPFHFLLFPFLISYITSVKFFIFFPQSSKHHRKMFLFPNPRQCILRLQKISTSWTLFFLLFTLSPVVFFISSHSCPWQNSAIFVLISQHEIRMSLLPRIYMLSTE